MGEIYSRLAPSLLYKSGVATCLVINQITVDNLAALLNCTAVDRASGSMMTQT